MIISFELDLEVGELGLIEVERDRFGYTAFNSSTGEQLAIIVKQRKQEELEDGILYIIPDTSPMAIITDSNVGPEGRHAIIIPDEMKTILQERLQDMSIRQLEHNCGRQEWIGNIMGGEYEGPHRSVMVCAECYNEILQEVRDTYPNAEFSPKTPMPQPQKTKTRIVVME